MTGRKRAFSRQRAVFLLSVAAIVYLLVHCATTGEAGCEFGCGKRPSEPAKPLQKVFDTAVTNAGSGKKSQLLGAIWN